MRLTRLAFLFLVSAGVCPAEVDFAHQVVPVLREHCSKCHMEDARKGGFSMNTRDLLIKGSENGAVVEGGKSHSEPPLKPRLPELPPVVDGRSHPVDRIIDRYFADHKVERPAPLGDAAFIRRLSMDLTGLLPEPTVISAFVSAVDPGKRAKLIELTLARDADYAEHWLSFWNDLLRNDYQGTGYIDGGRKQVTKWLYESLLKNKPYDQFARELLDPPAEDSQGFIDGIQWRGSVNASQSREVQFSQSISQTFLGLNMKCASCHDSFVDRWKLDEAYGLAAIYSDRPLEIERCDKPTGRMAKASWIFPELGQVDPAAARPERLKQLAALMTHKRALHAHHRQSPLAPADGPRDRASGRFHGHRAVGCGPAGLSCGAICEGRLRHEESSGLHRQLAGLSIGKRREWRSCHR